MNLVINTLSKEACLILFNDNRQIVDKIEWDIKGNESSTLIPQIDKLIKNNKLDYNSLGNIVVVNWPGSFTWVRTTILAINSINYIVKKSITELSFFDLFKIYPIIKSSSKRDCFIKKSGKSNIEILDNNEIINYLTTNNVKIISWDNNIKTDYWIELEKIDYLNIIKNIEFNNIKSANALYIKKPNIS